MADDDVLDSPFFLALQHHLVPTATSGGKTSFYTVIQEQCLTVCIPNSASLQDVVIDRVLMESHVFRMDEISSSLQSYFDTNLSVTIVDKKLIPHGYPVSNPVPILREELFYNHSYQPYRIFLISKPLTNPSKSPRVAETHTPPKNSFFSSFSRKHQRRNTSPVPLKHSKGNLDLEIEIPSLQDVFR